jgi:hypothetical protein
MLKKLISAAIFIILFFNSFVPINAINDPSSVANNKYGIHITDESDFKNAASLVNSGGGDWGYVTFVIRSDERDTKRWQTFFDELRELHLIPIVRIASKQGEGSWQVPSVDEIDGWVSFLNSLNWVIQNRYVIIGNEVNLGAEWGGKADPKGYANYFNIFSNKLKDQSGDYFIMLSALESTVKTGKNDISEEDFLNQMFEYDNNIFNKISGLASHSYPYVYLDRGETRGTLKHYEWELNILNNLGINKKLPVFITETGWMHGFGHSDANEISEKIYDAGLNVWSDEKVVAVTPFVLDYKTKPFDIYSWINPEGRRFEFFEAYQRLKKVSGTPIQVQSGEVVSYMLPRLIRTKFNNIYGFLYIKNTGQTIWKGFVPISLIINGKRTIIKPITILSDVLPGEKALAVYTIK